MSSVQVKNGEFTTGIIDDKEIGCQLAHDHFLLVQSSKIQSHGINGI